MCGLVGVAAPGRAPDGRVHAAVEALRHRGPDAHQVWTSDDASGISLGAVRLRIIDVSSEGDQPMCNEDGSVWVSFNGELYNHAERRAELIAQGHRFRSSSDTEVIVHAYEESPDDPQGLLDGFRGMFAIAIYDVLRGRLLLARDRLGIKPLYLADLPDGGLAFGSEVRAVATASGTKPEPDRASVIGYLERGVIPGPRTIFQGVRELPPGSLLTWSAGVGPAVTQWWSPRFDPRTNMTDDDANRMLTPILEDAVQRHLVADRPVGIFLSSGIDSSSIATIAAGLGEIRTFTVTFPDLAADEGGVARATAEHLGAQHTSVGITQQEAAAIVPGILGDMDQPTHDGVNSWLVSRAAHEAGLVVALSGLGGDELFGGYPTFSMVPRVDRLRRLLGIVPGAARNALARSAGRRAPAGRSARLWSSSPGVWGAYRSVRGFLSPAAVGRDAWPEREEQIDVAGLADADAIALLEMSSYLRDQTLRDTDQMSMAHALEVRVPLLDDAVVAAALRIPWKIRNAPGKATLARAAGLQGRHEKQPFALPFDHWLAKGKLREMVREGLLSETLPFADLIPTTLRQRLWAGLDDPRDHWSRPWGIAVLRLWPGANGLDW